MGDVTGQDWAHRWCVLRDSTGRVVQVGDKLKSFRGDAWRVCGGKPPRSPSSSGRIWVNKPGQVLTDFFPSVFDCTWVAEK